MASADGSTAHGYQSNGTQNQQDYEESELTLEEEDGDNESNLWQSKVQEHEPMTMNIKNSVYTKNTKYHNDDSFDEDNQDGEEI